MCDQAWAACATSECAVSLHCAASSWKLQDHEHHACVFGHAGGQNSAEGSAGPRDPERAGSGAAAAQLDGAGVGAGLAGVTVREWSAEDAAGDRGGAEDGEDASLEDSPEPPPCAGGDPGVDEEDAALRAESALSAAAYWDGLLRAHWQALEKEEGALHGRLGAPRAALSWHHAGTFQDEQCDQGLSSVSQGIIAGAIHVSGLVPNEGTTASTHACCIGARVYSTGVVQVLPIAILHP